MAIIAPPLCLHVEDEVRVRNDGPHHVGGCCQVEADSRFWCPIWRVHDGLERSILGVDRLALRQLDSTMPRAPTPARSPPPRPLRCGEITFRPTHDVGPHNQCISGLNHAAYGLPVNASRPGSPQAHASLGSGWRPTLAGWDWIPTGFRTRFQRSHHGILSPLTGLSRHTRCCTNRHGPARGPPTGSSPADAI